MGAFVMGEVVIMPFPFSDLTGGKPRPTLVIAELEGNDLILCQITSQARRDKYSIPLTNADFTKGGLNVDSFVRPNRLFTGDSKIISYSAGLLKDYKIEEVTNRLIEIITGKI